mmetsp:Transcript_19836/g.57541  ORF Transcript_19836/g.57541 Transcript_19836/m.57541 type:complete len:458 (+) Transcript_19836:51-1424(+)
MLSFHMRRSVLMVNMVLITLTTPQVWSTADPAFFCPFVPSRDGLLRCSDSRHQPFLSNAPMPRIRIMRQRGIIKISREVVSGPNSAGSLLTPTVPSASLSDDEANMLSPPTDKYAEGQMSEENQCVDSVITTASLGDDINSNKTSNAVERSHQQPYHGALHQVEHRAKEKTSIQMGEKAAEKLVEASARLATERAVERAAERGAERAIERAADLGGERALERTVDRAGERLFEAIAERGGERALERASEGGAKKLWARVLGKLTGECSAERAGKRFAEHLTKQVALKSTGSSGRRATQRGRALISTHMTEIGEHATETGLMFVTGKKATPAALVRSTGRIGERIGRGALIILPALGGILALCLLKSDVLQIRQELLEMDRVSRGSVLFASLFGVAAAADCLDAVCHLFIAHGMIKKRSHSVILRWEEISLACAVISTLFAVVGEVVGHRKISLKSLD